MCRTEFPRAAGGKLVEVRPAAAAFTVSLTIVWTITFGVGHFRDPALPSGDRIMGAQAAILGVALCVGQAQ